MPPKRLSEESDLDYGPFIWRQRKQHRFIQVRGILSSWSHAKYLCPAGGIPRNDIFPPVCNKAGSRRSPELINVVVTMSINQTSGLAWAEDGTGFALAADEISDRRSEAFPALNQWDFATFSLTMCLWLVTICFLTGVQRGERLAVIAKSMVDKTDNKGLGHPCSLSQSPA